MVRNMKANFGQQSNRREIQAAYDMPREIARKISADLALTHVAARAYYPNRQPNDIVNTSRAEATDIGRIALELQLVLVDELSEPRTHVVAPYCLPDDVAPQGIALWLPREATATPAVLKQS